MVNSKFELGTGSYGKVFLTRFKRDQRLYAIKIIQKFIIKENGTQDYVKQEIKIQKELSNRYVLKLYWAFEDKSNVYLVLEYAPNGSLYRYLK